MAAACRSWWRNCAVTADEEIRAIDAKEDELAPLNQDLVAIRELISGLELCHHKAEHWVEHIIAAIGAGVTTKGLGTRKPGPLHPAERLWQDVCSVLTAWCVGGETLLQDTQLDDVTISRLLAGLGTPTALKQWQVQRIIERVSSFINWPQAINDPGGSYRFLLLRAEDYDCAYVDDCPEPYRTDEAFWQQTVQTIIHDTEHGVAARLSLALAIDLLMPCHWDFTGNLRIVLAAIGGDLHPAEPFAACGRNIELVPIRHRMQTVCRALQFFYNDQVPAQGSDANILSLLGAPSAEKKWLAACLDKTIRLQLDPPAEVRAKSALTGPDWLN